jgi:phosphatidylserine decarboxylase
MTEITLVAQAAAAFSGMLGFVAFFNRNPSRTPPRKRNILVSPADGKIKAPFTIRSTREYFKADSKGLRELDRQGPLQVIPVNLSVLNVHVTRSPCNGKVVDITHQRGKFLPANFKKSLEKNQRNLIVMRTKHKGRTLPIAVIQSTGAVARRLRVWSQPGSTVSIGQPIGRILLGSNTAIIVPKHAVSVHVQSRQKVKAGESIVGMLR